MVPVNQKIHFHLHLVRLRGCDSSMYRKITCMVNVNRTEIYWLKIYIVECRIKAIFFGRSYIYVKKVKSGICSVQICVDLV